jgi:hypothetical protein
MKKILFFLPVLFLLTIACNDKGNGGSPLDNRNTQRDKDDNNRYKEDDNKDDFPNNRDEGMDRDYEDDMSIGKGSITGKWRLVDFRSDDGEVPTEEEMKSLRSSTIEFTRDGSYIATSKDPDGEVKIKYGSYTYDARSNRLETVEEKDGKRESLEVEFRGKNKVTLTFPEGSVTMERN